MRALIRDVSMLDLVIKTESVADKRGRKRAESSRQFDLGSVRMSTVAKETQLLNDDGCREAVYGQALLTQDFIIRLKARSRGRGGVCNKDGVTCNAA